jgi:hypothetical protein
MREWPRREYRPRREERSDSGEAARRMGDYSGSRADTRTGGEAGSKTISPPLLIPSATRDLRNRQLELA